MYLSISRPRNQNRGFPRWLPTSISTVEVTVDPLRLATVAPRNTRGPPLDDQPRASPRPRHALRKRGRATAAQRGTWTSSCLLPGVRFRESMGISKSLHGRDAHHVSAELSTNAPPARLQPITRTRARRRYAARCMESRGEAEPAEATSCPRWKTACTGWGPFHCSARTRAAELRTSRSGTRGHCRAQEHADFHCISPLSPPGQLELRRSTPAVHATGG